MHTNNKVEYRGKFKVEKQYVITDKDTGTKVNVGKSDLEEVLEYMKGKERKGVLNKCYFRIKDDILVLMNPKSHKTVKMTEDDIKEVLNK